MAVKRMVANIAADAVDPVKQFYMELFDLNIVMDQGWIATLASGEMAAVQISIATEGGSGTPVPDLSIEVDDVDATYQLAQQLGHQISYDITDEPWGVRRFYVVDPVGKHINVLAHLE